MSSGIYTITHSATGKRYVGSATSITQRWSCHKHHLAHGSHHSSKLQRAWDKHGKGAFEFAVVLICSTEMLTFYEQQVMDFYGAASHGYNCKPKAGSSLGYQHTPEALAKIARTSLGRKNQYAKGAVMSDEIKKKIGRANKGRAVTEETKAKLRVARAGRKPALGMRHSDAARAKMSMSRTGHAMSQHCREVLAKFRGRPHSDETKRLIGLKSGAARLGKPRGPYRKTISNANEERKCLM